MNTDSDYIFKVIFIGNSNVGKSSIMTRLSNNNFYEGHISTLGIDLRMIEKIIDNKRIKIQLWDTGGQERFKSIAFPFYRNSHYIAIVYDITERNSFDDIKDWMDNANKFSELNPNIILLGNKCDLEYDRQVSTEDGENIAKKYNIQFMEISAKESYNTKEFMDKVINQLIEIENKKNPIKNNNTVIISNKKEDLQKKNKFCGC
jgi:Ras-related protein Rab-1A